MRRLGLSYPVRTWTQHTNLCGANMLEVQCCMLANDGNLYKRGQIKPFSQPTSYLVWKNCPCKTVVSESLFSIALSDFTSSRTTGRTEVTILVSSWPEHSLTSNLREPIFLGEACPHTIPCSALVLSHPLISRWPYRDTTAAPSPVQ